MSRFRRIRRDPLRLSRLALLEPLESRMMLAAVSWDGGGDGSSWADPLNWSANALPGSADDVTIDVSGTPTIQFNSGLFFINSLSCAENFNLSGGTLAIAAASAVSGAFSLSGGTLGGFGTLNLNGLSSWTGGTMEGPGRTAVGSAGSLSITGSSLSLLRPLDNAGTINWSSGSAVLVNGSINNLAGGLMNVDAVAVSSGGGSNAINNAGTFNTIGPSQVVIGAGVQFTSSSTVNVSSGTLQLLGGGVASGSLSLTGNLILDGSHVFFATSTFSGPGQIIFAGGSAIVNGTVSTSGPVNFTGATVTLNGAFQPTGTVNFAAGSVTANTVLGSGSNVVIQGANVAVNANQTWASLTLTAGSLSGTGRVTLSQSLTWQGGAMTGTGVTSAAAASSVTFSGLTKTLARLLEIAGTATWNGGQFQLLDGTLATLAGGTFNANANEQVLSAGGANLVSNAGTWQTGGGGQTTIGNGVTFSNTGVLNVNLAHLALNGPVLEVQNSTLTAGMWNLSNGYGIYGTPFIGTNSTTVSIASGSTFTGFNPSVNNGTITLRDGTGAGFNYPFVNTGTLVVNNASPTLSGAFNNEGTVRVESGTLRFTGTGTHSGAFGLLGGTTIFNENQTFLLGSSIAGAGDVFFGRGGGSHVIAGSFNVTGATNIVSGDRVAFESAANISAGVLSGTISGAGALTITGGFTWQAGSMEGSGTTTVGPGGTLTMPSPGSGATLFLRRLLTNSGTMTLPSGNVFLGGGRIQNNADGVMSTLVPATGDFSILAEFPDAQNAVVNAGTINVNGTGLSIGVPLNSSGTVNTIPPGGSFTASGGGQGTGTFNAQSGSIVFQGGYTFSATSRLIGNSPITLSGGSYVFNGSLGRNAYLQVTSGMLEIPGAQTLGSLILSNSTLTGAGNITVLSSLTMQASRVEGLGRLTVVGDAQISGGPSTVARPVDLLTTAAIQGTEVTIQNVPLTILSGANVSMNGSVITGTGALDIAGSLTTTGTCTIDAAMSLLGSLTVANTSLTITRNSQIAGQLNVSSGSLLFNVPQTYFSTASTSVTGFMRVTGDQAFLGPVSGGGRIETTGAMSHAGAVTGNHQFVSGGDLVFNGTYNESNASINSGGGVTFNGSTTLGNISVDALGDIRFNAALNWLGGTLGSTSNGSRVIFGPSITATLGSGGSNNRVILRGVENRGNVNLTAGNLQWLGGGTWENLQGSSLAASSSTSLVTTTQSFNNAGSFVMASGSSLAAQGGTLPVNNLSTGVISWTGNTTGTQCALTNAVGGRITFNTISSPFTILNQGLFTASGGNTSVGAIGGNGQINLTGGTLSFGGSTYAGSITTSGGSSLFLSEVALLPSAQLTASGTVNLSYSVAGTVVPANITVNSGGTVNVNNGRLTGTVSLAGSLGGSFSVAAGTVNWTGGSIGGTSRFTIAPTGILNIQGTGAKTLAGALDNQGTINWTGGTVSGGILNILPDAVLNASAAASFSGTLQNFGVVNRTGSGATTLTGTTINAGIVHTQFGTLALNGGGLHSGIFNTDAGATTSFSGVHLISGACALDGDGTIAVTGGSVQIDGMLSPNGELSISGGSVTVGELSVVRSLQLTGGSLGGTGEVVVTGALGFLGGALGGTGGVTLGEAATAEIRGAGLRTITGRLDLRDAASVVIGSGDLRVAPTGEIVLGSTTLIADVTPWTLTNLGTIRSRASGSTVFGSQVTLANTGQILADGGTIRFEGPLVDLSAGLLSAGRWTAVNSGFIDLAGRGITQIGPTARIDLGQSGTVGILSGLHSIPGTLTLDAGSMLTVEPSGNNLGLTGNMILGAGAILQVLGGVRLENSASVQTTLALDGAGQPSAGRILASGNATLNGALAVGLQAGPAFSLGSVFEIVTGASLDGAFATIQLPGNPAGNKFCAVTRDSTFAILLTSIRDFNCDGDVNPDDLGDYINAFFALGPGADFNGDGDINPDDLGDYINAYFG